MKDDFRNSMINIIRFLKMANLKFCKTRSLVANHYSNEIYDILSNRSYILPECNEILGDDLIFFFLQNYRKLIKFFIGIFNLSLIHLVNDHFDFKLIHFSSNKIQNNYTL